MTRLKRLIPKSLLRRRREIQRAIALRREFRSDRKRYAAAMLPEDDMAHAGLTGRNLEAQLTKDYHRVEKGLALRTPRQPFGADVADRMDLLAPHAAESPYAAHVESARVALHEWNSSGLRSDLVSPPRHSEVRGIEDVERFFGTRHSVRDFADVDVSPDLLTRAVALAVNTPSVCNRQAWRVRFFHGDAADRIRRHQNGNAGFGQIPVIALITVDAQMFAGAGERNQGWIEGGLFAMSLAWVLHGLGLDTCLLNMSVGNAAADALRLEEGIPPEELIIMMMAIGYGREGHRRARSPRRHVDEVIA